jgi:hypothetical protein
MRKSLPPRGLVIATAEKGLTVQSIVGRTVTVPIDLAVVPHNAGQEDTPLDIAQRQASDGLYAQALAVYLQWLIRRWPELETELHARFEDAHRAVRGLFPPGQSRLLDYFACLYVPAGLALELYVEHGSSPPPKPRKKT